MKQKNAVCKCSEEIYKHYAKRNVEIRVNIVDTDFYVLLVRRSKKNITVFFRCLKQFYSYTLDDDLPSFVFDYDWMRQFFTSFYEFWFNTTVNREII